jgi:hypothetical protein
VRIRSASNELTLEKKRDVVNAMARPIFMQFLARIAEKSSGISFPATGGQ